MKVTQKLRRWLLLSLAVLLLGTIIVPIFPSGRAYAADASEGSFIATEVLDRVEKKNKFMFLRYCFEKAKTFDKMEESDVDGWDYFDVTNSVLGDGYDLFSITGNLFGPGKDATESCGNGNAIGDAFEALGFTDSRRVFCSLDGAVLVEDKGFSNDAEYKGSECYSKELSNDYFWDVTHDDKSRLRKSFEELVRTSTPEVEGSGVNAWVTEGLQGHEEYVRYYISFMEQCGTFDNDVAIDKNSYSAGDAEPDDKYQLTVVTQEGDPQDVLASGQVSSGSQVAIQAEINGSEYKMGDGESAGDFSNDVWPRGKVVSCNTAIENVRKYAPAYADWVRAHPDAEGNTTVTGPGAGKDSIGADCAGFSFSNALTLEWMLCPLIQGTMEAAGALESQIAGMLCINETDIFAGSNMTCDGEQGKAESQDAFHNAWNVFRIMALGLLAIAGLLMILSQGLGFEIFDAYTIKKTLPRILVAGIAISLSWPLLEAVVTFSNALGIGIRSLIYQPFIQSGMDAVILRGGEASFASIMGIGAGAAAWAILGPLGLLSFAATGLLAIMIAFFVLVIRNILVILLVIIAPVAIAMYILPNTEKWAKTWWDWFFKALLAFPIITAMIAIGHVFAAITSQKGGGLLMTIVAFIAYFAPYFLIPAAFRFAGGAIATIGGFANDRSRGGFDRIKGFRKNQSEKRMGYYGQQIGDRTMQARAEAVRRLNASASKHGRVTGGLQRFAGRQIAGLGGIESKMSAINARTAKQMNDQIATGADSDIRGLTVDRSMGWENARAQGLARVNGGKRQWKSLGGAWIDESDVIEGQRKWGRDVAGQQAALSYEMRKAMTDDDVQGISDRYSNLARKQWGMTDTQAGGAWIGAGFENQNQHIEYKNTNWEDGQLDAAKFSKELYEKKGSYQLSQMSAHTMKQMKHAYDVGDDETKRRIQATAEVFMQRGGAGGGAMVGDDDGRPIMAPGAGVAGGGSRGYYQASSQGSGHVGEAVRDMAVHVGVYRPLDPSTDIHSAGGPSANPRQN
ncbi:MAG TPA: hypothetical protein VGE30_03720 [Candidatus Saccharimonadales bacterium]